MQVVLHQHRTPIFCMTLNITPNFPVKQAVRRFDTMIRNAFSMSTSLGWFPLIPGRMLFKVWSHCSSVPYHTPVSPQGGCSPRRLRDSSELSKDHVRVRCDKQLLAHLIITVLLAVQLWTKIICFNQSLQFVNQRSSRLRFHLLFRLTVVSWKSHFIFLRWKFVGKK